MTLKVLAFTSVLLLSSIINAGTPATDFSVAQIPDTQGFIKPDLEACVSPDQVVDMYRWIFNDHKTNNKNYQYIFHVGDIIGNPGYLDNPNDPYGQWAQASKAFGQINSENPGIPYGLTSGNHDYLWDRKSEGYGNYATPQALDVYYKFLKPLYESKNSSGDTINGNQFIDDPMYVPSKYPSGKFYPISYRPFTIKGHNFVALNLPYGLTNSPGAMQNVNKFIDDTDALFILNIHTPDGTQFQPGGSFNNLINNKKKIFMVLYGHDLNTVSKGKGYEIAPNYIRRDNTQSPAYVYRFDYQERSPYICAPAKPDNGSNMPQHPLLRVYEFMVDWPNQGDLSWKAKDVQAWTDRPIYKSIYWDWGTGSAPTSASTQQYPNPNAETVKTIQYANYLTPNTACKAPIQDDAGGPNCNKKVGTTITICWKPKGATPNKYDVRDYNNNPLTTTSNTSYDNKNVGPSPSGYLFNVYSICEGGTPSSALQIHVSN